MPKRPWITPQQVRDYSETPEVLKRSDAKLSVDISRAEQYIITYTHNKGLEEMEELPEGVRDGLHLAGRGLRTQRRPDLLQGAEIRNIRRLQLLGRSLRHRSYRSRSGRPAG